MVQNLSLQINYKHWHDIYVFHPQNKGDFTRLGELYKEHQRIFLFYRCASKAVLDTCVDFDFNSNVAEYDLQGGYGAAYGLSDANKRWFVYSTFTNFDSIKLWKGLF